MNGNNVEEIEGYLMYVVDIVVLKLIVLFRLLSIVTRTDADGCDLGQQTPDENRPDRDLVTVTSRAHLSVLLNCAKSDKGFVPISVTILDMKAISHRHCFIRT